MLLLNCIRFQSWYSNRIFLYAIIGNLIFKKLKESFCVEFIAKHLEKIVQMEEFRKYVEQDAFSIQERQATDSIPLIDEIRTQLHKIYGEDETLILTQDFISLDRKRVKFQVLEKFLLDIGIDG